MSTIMPEDICLSDLLPFGRCEETDIIRRRWNKEERRKAQQHGEKTLLNT